MSFIGRHRRGQVKEVGCRAIRVDDYIAVRYAELRKRHPSLEKEDALIAATALVRGLPLVTRNSRHYKVVEGLTLIKGVGGRSG